MAVPRRWRPTLVLTCRRSRRGRPSRAQRLAFVAVQGCATFPEIEVNATGTPFTGASPTGPVRGFIDDHIHIGAFDFPGGRLHCGRPWSPCGVADAMKDCPDHEPAASPPRPPAPSTGR